jgi:hypothetical protein
MAKFVVKWQEVTDYSIEVDAESRSDALDLAWGRVKDEDITMRENFDIRVEEVEDGDS